MVSLYDIVKAADVLYIGIQGVYVASYSFGIAETLQLYGIAGETVFDEEAGREFPVIAMASEAMHHKHRGLRASAAPLPVKDIPLFASFHSYIIAPLKIAALRIPVYLSFPLHKALYRLHP